MAILLGDQLIVHRRQERAVYSVGVPLYHAIKTVAHLAVAVAARASVAEHLTKARQSLEALEVDDLVRADLCAALDACSDPPGDLRELGRILLRLTDHATKVQLTVLHRQVEMALADFDADERRQLEVLVAGDHQARSRSLGMQYFSLRLGEEEGSEERVAFGEAVTTEEEALALVATRRLDRELAGRLFGDRRRLQRDILGDAAKSQLEALHLDRI